MAESTSYLIFSGAAGDDGVVEWRALGVQEATSPKQAVEAQVTLLTARGEAQADCYAACPVRNWSAGPVTVENKPTVRANLATGAQAAQVANDRVKGTNGSAAGVDSGRDAEPTTAIG